MSSTDFSQTLVSIADATGIEFDLLATKSVDGGDINQAYRVTASDDERYFLKLNQPDAAEMFAAEKVGLEALAHAEQLRVPFTVATGSGNHHAWLLLEWLDLTTGNANAARHLGRALADLHQIRGDQFGFDADNTIGRTPQRNDWRSNWVTFYRDFRLVPQLELAVDNGVPESTRRGLEKLLPRIESWFEDYSPSPALLHGDLWAGNWAMLPNGQPAVFDPAAYYGDREADIAMTYLFGGFPAEFYVAYQAAWPLDEGAEKRRPLYNLYHVLNHFNLFGSGYLAQADRIITGLLTQEQ